MPEDKTLQKETKSILTQEQDALLDLYLKHIDKHFDSIKESEKVQVEIEMLHLKRILGQ